MSSEKKNNDYLLEVEHLKQYFPVHQGFSLSLIHISEPTRPY